VTPLQLTLIGALVDDQFGDHHNKVSRNLSTDFRFAEIDQAGPSLHRATPVTRRTCLCVSVCRTPTHTLPPQTLTYGKWQLFQFKADRQKISDWFLFDKEVVLLSHST